MYRASECTNSGTPAIVGTSVHWLTPSSPWQPLQSATTDSRSPAITAEANNPSVVDIAIEIILFMRFPFSVWRPGQFCLYNLFG
jgi:hypothetical protein